MADFGPVLIADDFVNLQDFCLARIVADCQCVLTHRGVESYTYEPYCDPNNRVATIPAVQACKDRCICSALERERLDGPNGDLAAAQARQGLGPKPAAPGPIHT